MRTTEFSSAWRQPSLVLISLTLFLLLLPLTLSKPGLPISLKADEAAYYLAALSLWHDGDLICDNDDARRLFREYAGTDNLILMSQDQGETVYFGVPIFYPLLATPFVALFGANGMVMLNAALLMAMVWMGVTYLRRYNSESLAILFAAGFFLLSTAFVYVFWLQAEIFNMACVMAAFFLVERGGDGAAKFVARARARRRLALHAMGAAAMLALASYSRPMLVVLALPMLYLLIKARSWRGLAAFAAAGWLTAMALSGAAYAFTEQVWPYFAPRAGVSLSSPVDYVERRASARFAQRSQSPATHQIARSGEQLQYTLFAFIREATPEFFYGRHGGFLVYMPFAVLAILFFLLRERRSVFRWLILVAAALTAALFVVTVRGHWLGGGGFVGNRYFTAVYPSFLFLVRHLRPSWLTAGGYAAAAIFLGPLLITPLGALVVEHNMQAHVRNQPFPNLPIEWSMERNLAGYRQILRDGVLFHGRRDVLLDRGDELWVQGAKKVEINMLGSEQHRGFVFDVRNLAPGNRLEICLQDECQQLTFGAVSAAGSSERVTFSPRHGIMIPRAGRGADTYRHRLTVTSEWGEQPRWRGSGKENFYLGAALVLLGSPVELAQDLRSVEWLGVDAPAAMTAGSTVAVPIAIRNSSPHAWPSTGVTRVSIGYHWLSENGDPITWEGKRTPLPADVAAGARVWTAVQVTAPENAGPYLLALDLVRQRMHWFSTADAEMARRVAVEVVAASVDSQAP